MIVVARKKRCRVFMHCGSKWSVKSQSLGGAGRSLQEGARVVMVKKDAHILEIEKQTVTVSGKSGGPYGDGGLALQSGKIANETLEFNGGRDLSFPPFVLPRTLAPILAGGKTPNTGQANQAGFRASHLQTNFHNPLLRLQGSPLH